MDEACTLLARSSLDPVAAASLSCDETRELTLVERPPHLQGKHSELAEFTCPAASYQCVAGGDFAQVLLDGSVGNEV